MYTCSDQDFFWVHTIICTSVDNQFLSTNSTALVHTLSLWLSESLFLSESFPGVENALWWVTTRMIFALGWPVARFSMSVCHYQVQSYVKYRACCFILNVCRQRCWEIWNHYVYLWVWNFMNFQLFCNDCCISSVQSLDRLGHWGDMRGDSADILLQSLLQEAIVSSSCMGTDGWPLFNIVHPAFPLHIIPQHPPPHPHPHYPQPPNMVFERLSWCVVGSVVSWCLVFR